MKPQEEQEGVDNKQRTQRLQMLFSPLFFLLGKRQIFSPVFLSKIVEVKDLH